MDLRRVALLQMKKQDVVIAISYSGEKPEILDVVQKARDRGIRVIAITRTGETTLASLAHITFDVAAFEKDFRSSALTSRISQLYVVDTLFHTCCALLGDEKMVALQETYAIIRR